MELQTIPQEYVELLINVAVPLIATILFVAVTSIAGAGTWGTVKRVFQWSRQFVDEPTDYAIIIAGQTFNLPPEKASEFAKKFIDEITGHDALPLGEPIPETLPDAS